jgi:hypothetical protein
MRELDSIGFAAYLEPLNGESGALRVVPGSHRPELGEALGRYLAEPIDIAAVPSTALVTEPGDIIAFDEHLFHASSGGNVRRQWRVDYFRDPRTQESEAAVRRYLAGIFPADFDGGYDVDRFPSYGRVWLESRRSAVERLRGLGAYELADAQERFTRSRRR